MPQQIVLVDAAVAHIEDRELDQVSELGAGLAQDATHEIHRRVRLSLEIAEVTQIVALVQVDLPGDEDHLVADDALAVVGDAGRQPPMARGTDVTARQHQTPSGKKRRPRRDSPRPLYR